MELHKRELGAGVAPRKSREMASRELVCPGYRNRALWIGLSLELCEATCASGTWTNGAAGIAGALLGASSPLMPTLNKSLPPPNGIDNPVVSALLQVRGVTIMVALLMTLYGLFRSKTSRW